MNDKRERLLRDLIRDPGYEAFRAELWQATVAEIQRGRWQRTCKRYLALAACLALTGLLFAWRVWLPRGGTAHPDSAAAGQSPRASSLEVVHTSSSGIEQISTRPRHDSSTPPPPNSVVIVHTVAKPGPELLLSDRELQGLFAGHPTALVALGGGRERFLFLDASEEAEFFVQPVTR